MQPSVLTPETIFHPTQSPLIARGHNQPRPSEQQQYKWLIDSQARQKNLPLAHLAEKVSRKAASFHKIIRGPCTLEDNLRESVFLELGIDHVRAAYCVVFLRDYRAYGRPAVQVASEAIKGIGYELESRRLGEIQIDVKPPVVHEATRQFCGMLLTHQERVMSSQFKLQT